MTLMATWLWQGLAIAWLTALVLRTMPRLNAATRHVIWWLALAAVLLIPVIHGIARVAADPVTQSATGFASNADAVIVLPAIPQAMVAAAVFIWALTALAGLLRTARGCRALERLKRLSAPFPPARETRLPMWLAARASAPRPAELRDIDGRSGACALGLGRPVILVSRQLADALGDEALDEIVMHEQAHLDRYDDWSQLVQAIVSSLAALHPAVRFLAGRIDVDREAACDDRVVARTGAARRYASSLARAAACPVGLAGPGVALGATGSASALRERVERLLDPRRDRGARLGLRTSLLAIVALALAVAAAPRATSLVVFVERADLIAPVPNPPTPPRQLAARAPQVAERPDVITFAASTVATPPTPVPMRPWTAPPPDARPQEPTEGNEAPPRPVDTPITAPSVLPSTSISGQGQPLVGLSDMHSTFPTVADGSIWSAVADTTTAAAVGTADDFRSTGVRAGNAGVSIGRFMSRAGSAIASRF